MPHRWPRKAQELLSDFIERAQELLRVQGHMNNLMGAIVSMTEDLSLPSVLESVAESAADIVGARSAAIGVLDDRGELSDFITVGPDEDAARLIGHGALNEPVGDAQPDRLRDLGQHPLADGASEDEPPLHFLGVPIRMRDAVFGNLYLIEKEDGEAFTAEDEELASTLAAAAGVAIQNARLYEESRRSQRWLEAGIATSESLIMENSPTSTDDLALVAEHALAAADCLLAVVAHSVDGGSGSGPPSGPWRWRPARGSASPRRCVPRPSSPAPRCCATPRRSSAREPRRSSGRSWRSRWATAPRWTTCCSCWRTRPEGGPSPRRTTTTGPPSAPTWGWPSSSTSPIGSAKRPCSP
ncbi:GAF domain-containing protein [Sinomonas atrocyanea]